MKPLTFVGLVVLLLSLAAPADANNWIAAGSDTLWNNPDNWSQGIVPPNGWRSPSSWDDPDGLFYPLTPDDPSDDLPLWVNDAQLTADGATILIDASVTDAAAYGVRVGVSGVTNTLEITGGRLEVGGIPPEEVDRVGWHLDVGRGFNQSVNPEPTATLLMSGGEVETNGFLIPEQFVDDSQADPYDTAPLNGEVLMSGTIVARWMNVGQFVGNGNAELSGDAEIILWPNIASSPNNGGHLVMNRDWFILGQPVASVGDTHIDIRDNAVINIFGNQDELTSVPDEEEVDRYQQYVDDGWLTANEGTAEPVITLGPCPDDGRYDDYCLSGVMITITAPLPLGDFNSDGNWDCEDINALTEAIATSSTDLSFDMNGDGVINLADITDADVGWLAVGGAQNPMHTGGNPYLEGDANLDGSVDVSDFNAWNSSKFTQTPEWCSGDFNASGSVDVSDFNIWNGGKFTSSSGGLSAVPEPSAGGLLVFGCGLLVSWWSRRK